MITSSQMNISKNDDNDETIETLLNLDGTIYYFDNGYWVKFEAKKVSSNKHNPYGIDYSLTLHDRRNNRILGYDNTHQIKSPIRHRFRRRKTIWDHKHEFNRISLYKYESAGQLLEDFWKNVDKIIKN